MNYTWIYIMILMFAGNFVLQMVPLLYYFEAVIIINLLVLAGAYFILRRDNDRRRAKIKRQKTEPYSFRKGNRVLFFYRCKNK